MSFIRDRSIITAPSSTQLPAALCTPPRTVRSVPVSRHRAITVATASVVAGRAMSAGWRVIDPFQTASARASAKPASAGRTTSPGKSRMNRSRVASSRDI